MKVRRQEFRGRCFQWLNWHGKIGSWSADEHGDGVLELRAGDTEICGRGFGRLKGILSLDQRNFSVHASFVTGAS